MNNWQETYGQELSAHMVEMAAVASALGAHVEVQIDQILEIKLVIDGQTKDKITINKQQSTATRTVKKVGKRFAEELTRSSKLKPKYSIYERIRYQKYRAGMLTVPNNWTNENLAYYSLGASIFEKVAKPGLVKQLNKLMLKNNGKPYELTPGVTMPTTYYQFPLSPLTVHKQLAQTEEEFADADL